MKETGVTVGRDLRENVLTSFALVAKWVVGRSLASGLLGSRDTASADPALQIPAYNPLARSIQTAI